MLNQIYIHYINTLFVLESFIISCWLLKGKKIGIGIGIGQFARKKTVSESESASLLEKNRYRNRPRKIMIGASLIFMFIVFISLIYFVLYLSLFSLIYPPLSSLLPCYWLWFLSSLLYCSTFVWFCLFSFCSFQMARLFTHLLVFWACLHLIT